MGQPRLPAEAPAAPAPQPPPPTTRVLLLFGEPRMIPAVVALDAVFRSTLESRSPVPVSFYTEFLDVNLFQGGVVPLPELRELLRRKYETRPLDLIVASGSRALRIALHNREDLFSNAPIVFASVDRRAAADLRLNADVTGTWLHQAWGETLDLARHLQPGIRRAVVVTGVSPADRVWTEAARTQLAASGPIEVLYVAGRSLEDILAEVKSLPEHTVILVGAFTRDATGRDFVPREAARQVAAASSVPVYGLFDGAIGTGVVGGDVVSFDAHGRTAAELALRVLAGERPSPTHAGTTVPTFDARQLARWKLDARRLPSGSLVLFQEPSLWALYRWYIVGALGIVLLQSGLIASLLVLHAQRRRAQDSLAERLRFETLLSELSNILAASPVDADRQVQTAIQRIVEALGIDWGTVRDSSPASRSSG